MVNSYRTDVGRYIAEVTMPQIKDGELVVSVGFFEGPRRDFLAYFSFDSKSGITKIPEGVPNDFKGKELSDFVDETNRALFSLNRSGVITY